MSRLSELFEILKLYGFVIIDENQKKFLDELRDVGVIHLFNVRRVGRYIVLELNILNCERDCSISCRDGFGMVKGDCYSECIDTCIRDKLDTISRAFSQFLNLK